MVTHAPPSPTAHPSKRPRQSTPDNESPRSLSADTTGGSGAQGVTGGVGRVGGGAGGWSKPGQSSNFRNVSACNRCRLRKNRCDQKLPSCASCEKANVACVGYDPITKREIPRSYVFYLEARVQQLENLLSSHNLSIPPADSLEYCSRPSHDLGSVRSPTEAGRSSHSDALDDAGTAGSRNESGDVGRPHKLASSRPAGLAQASEDPPSRYLGSVPGLTFARVVFAAVQSSMSDQKSTSEKTGVRPYRPPTGTGGGGSSSSGGGGGGGSDESTTGPGTSMRDSFFGLHTRPTIHAATFPNKTLARRLITLYFEHANPQIPVLHRGDFMAMFEQAYADENSRVRGPKELYMLNMVFAIGGGIIMGDSAKTGGNRPQSRPSSPSGGGDGDDDPGSKQCQPEEYHASAIVHLESCLSNSVGGLAELQAVLLLANFALLRPVPPGLWYIVGVATRLAVDLGLHYEDGKTIDSDLVDAAGAQPSSQAYARERGRREYVRDLRRRLWWCTYAFDRLVSICVGRPFGVSDQAITTEFPSLLEDRYITLAGFVEPLPGVAATEPTYKLVAHHYFRLRLLQSEILQVLQYQQAQVARASGQNQNNPYMHSRLPSPFLSKYDSFRSWRIDIDRRLYEWKTSAPTREDTGVAFSTSFLELNYWQAIIMLYRQSLSVPALFEGEYHTAKEVDSPSVHNVELREDEDRVYLKVAEAGQRIIRLYRQLHLDGLVNYTYLATHHIFISGVAYLYAIWHSPIVRSRLSMEEVDFTVLAATSVFSALTEKCPPAEACRDAFNRTAKATVKMASSTGGFGQPDSSILSQRLPFPGAAANHGESSGADPGLSDEMVAPASASRFSNTQQHLPARSLAQDGEPPSARLVPIPRMHGNHGPSSTASRKAKGGDEPGLATPILSIPRGNNSSSNSNYSRMMASATATTTSSSPTGITRAAEDLDIIDAPPSSSTSIRSRQQQQQPLLPVQAADSPASPTVAAIKAGSPTPTAADTATTSRMSDFYASDHHHQQQQQPPLGPGTAVNLSDLQGMEFLQSLSGHPGGTATGTGAGVGAEEETAATTELGNGDTQMEFNFGLGWEGLHHDFSDGQQYDLFDGFFFGDQRGGGERG